MMTDSDAAATPLHPREQLPVTAFGGVALAVRHPDGTIYLSIRDLCNIIGVIYPTVNDWACPWRYQPEDRHPRP
jgi:hypothetical protein